MVTLIWLYITILRLLALLAAQPLSEMHIAGEPGLGAPVLLGEEAVYLLHRHGALADPDPFTTEELARVLHVR